ncbi:hypothetical protein GCM10010309_71940 [Streptomyces violaceochromogenes]|nr:hypothetical protein GCM10010309_71940 [Streptomyces violaceochromogenes]
MACWALPTGIGSGLCLGRGWADIARPAPAWGFSDPVGRVVVGRADTPPGREALTRPARRRC